MNAKHYCEAPIAWVLVTVYCTAQCHTKSGGLQIPRTVRQFESGSWQLHYITIGAAQKMEWTYLRLATALFPFYSNRLQTRVWILRVLPLSMTLPTRQYYRQPPC